MKKLNNYKFWMSLFAAVIVLINALGSAFGFAVNEIAITSIFTAVLGVFVTLGLIKKENKESEKTSQNSDDNSTKNNEDSLKTDEQNDNKKVDFNNEVKIDAKKQSEHSSVIAKDDSTNIQDEGIKSTKSNKKIKKF